MCHVIITRSTPIADGWMRNAGPRHDAGMSDGFRKV
jgi:hypothetical protein